MAFTTNFHWGDTLSLLYDDVLDIGAESHYQVMCKNQELAKDYTGQNYCAYNLGMNLL